jgi:hypothetical protein
MFSTLHVQLNVVNACPVYSNPLKVMLVFTLGKVNDYKGFAQ